MRWKKIKKIFTPHNNFTWMVSHAANPFAVRISENTYRIYFTCRNAENESHIAFVDVDFENNFTVIHIADKPVLKPGDPGIFDDSGTTMSCIIHANNTKYLYYLGWNLKVKVPWLNTIGLAIWNEQTQTFEKFSRAPLLDRSDEDPFTVSYPFVLYENGMYRMWYGSNLKWGSKQEDMNHIIKYAESTDGIHWNRTNQIHINLIYPNEYAVSKPLVIKNSNGYEMFYCYRANGNILTYRIGYAISTDGFTWKRKDEQAGIDVSAEGWDSEMICYPYVFDHHDKRYMLYNGNGYGKTGFGIAQLI